MDKENQQSMEECEALWNEYEPSLRKICERRLSGYRSEIDDVIGDTFLALCNAINKGVYIQNYGAWLRGVLNNFTKKRYTELSNRKKKFVHIDSIARELYYIVDFDEENLSDNEIEEIKDEIYNQLNTTEKTLLILIYSKKMKLAEIAEKMNTSEAAVRQRHYRLKIKIRHLVMERMKNVG